MYVQYMYVDICTGDSSRQGRRRMTDCVLLMSSANLPQNGDFGDMTPTVHYDILSISYDHITVHPIWGNYRDGVSFLSSTSRLT